jgi:hypothetical protein
LDEEVHPRGPRKRRCFVRSTNCTIMPENEKVVEVDLDTIMSPSDSDQQQHNSGMGGLPAFSRVQQISSTIPSTPAPRFDAAAPPNNYTSSLYQDQEGKSSLVAEKDVAGPSRISLALRREKEGADNSTSRLGGRIRKKPAKLTLPSQPSLKRNVTESSFLQVKETLGHTSRSVPSSPMLPSMRRDEIQETEEEREQLRATLRGTPRRRPSVPFGLRM